MRFSANIRSLTRVNVAGDQNELASSNLEKNRRETVSSNYVLAVETHFSFRYRTVNTASVSDTKQCGRSKSAFLFYYYK